MYSSTHLPILHQFAVLFAVLAAAPSAVSAKPRGVHLDRELASARLVTPARILAYEADGLRFQPLGRRVEPMTATYSASDPTWNPQRLVPEVWPPTDGIWTDAWPPVGAEVLVVIGEDGAVSLFAVRQGDEYRFWSPMMTGSVALFSCRPPARVLSAEAAIPHMTVGQDGQPAGWDGCLMPASAVVEKGLELQGHTRP